MGCVLSKEEEQQEEHEEEEESLSSFDNTQRISPCELLPLVKTKKQIEMEKIQNIFNNEYKKLNYLRNLNLSDNIRTIIHND